MISKASKKFKIKLVKKKCVSTKLLRTLLKKELKCKNEKLTFKMEI